MGIRGLSTFFNNNPDLSKPHKLFDTPVIIDGNNLIHLLYFRHKVDCVFGGDYNKYAAAIKKYFSPFLECNIRPIVIFDGGYDKTNRKFRTTLLRSRTRLTLTKHIAKYGVCAGNVLPINCQEVFRSVLSEMDIPFAQCDFEADDQITALANHYDCPVLSDDSDFYIFDIRKGFVRLSSIEASVVEKTIDGVKCKYIKCSIYHIDKFLSFFPGIDRNVLPLFGTLVGNDFANAGSFENFFSSIQLPKPKCKGLKVNPNQRKIMALLNWLKNFSLEEGIDQVLNHLKKEKRDSVKSIIDQSVESYRTQKCNLTYVIEGELKKLEEALEAEGRLATQCGEPLPIPFMVSFHEGNLPSLFLNIINLHRTFLPAQVEDVSLESSYVCSRYIRQIIYGFLLQHSTAHTEFHTQNCCSRIEEFDRRSGSLAKDNIMPIFTFKNGSPLPNLCDVYTMEKNILQHTICLVLDTEVSHILSVPSSMQLLFASINYWLKNCSCKPREEFISALVINLIYFNYILKEPATYKNRSVNGLQDPILVAIDNVAEADATTAAQNMKKYLQKPVFNNGNPLILHIIHCYSELQTCILYSVYLNMLLGWPFEHPKLHESFCGTLLYNLTKELMSRPYPDLFIAELLGRKSSLTEIFSLLKSKILRNVSVECLEQIDRSEVPKRKRNKKSKSQQAEENQSTVFNKFQCLSTVDKDFGLDDSEDIFI